MACQRATACDTFECKRSLETPVASERRVVPLCVDLDGTLIKTDLVWESLIRLLKQNPLYCFAVLFWLVQGRACLKAKIAARVELDYSSLPYNEAVLDYVRAERS